MCSLHARDPKAFCEVSRVSMLHTLKLNQATKSGGRRKKKKKKRKDGEQTAPGQTLSVETALRKRET